MDEAGTHRTLVGPKNWSATVYEMDVRPGGVWRYRLAPDKAGEGEEAFCKAIYSEVVELSRLVFTDTFTDQNWNSVAGDDMLTSVAFEEDGDGTRLSIITHFASAKELEVGSHGNGGRIHGYAGTVRGRNKFVHKRTIKGEMIMNSVMSNDGTRIFMKRKGLVRLLSL